MAEDKPVCSSCKRRVTNLTNTTRFMCPKCGKYEIVRCGHCRDTIAKYKCHECGFMGPN